MRLSALKLDELQWIDGVLLDKRASIYPYINIYARGYKNNVYSFKNRENYTTELVSIFLGGYKLWQNEKEQVLSLQD